jgi:hypothetical protein
VKNGPGLIGAKIARLSARQASPDSDCTTAPKREPHSSLRFRGSNAPVLPARKRRPERSTTPDPAATTSTFFLRLAEQLLWPLLLLATSNNLTMRDVVTWILTLPRRDERDIYLHPEQHQYPQLVQRSSTVAQALLTTMSGFHTAESISF